MELEKYKFCAKCDTNQLKSEFTLKRNGLDTTCRECKRKYNRKYRNKNRNKIKNRALQYSFGITLVQYNQLFSQQNGCCGICKQHQTQFKKAFAVDHQHSTGVIRGLLCANCNKGIGNLQESIEILKNSIDYLTKETYTDLKVPKENQ